MITNSQRIFIALIHNNEAKRLDYIQPCLLALQKSLSEKFNIQLQQFAYQPDMLCSGRCVSILREILFRTYAQCASFLYREQGRYLLRKIVSRLFARNPVIEIWRRRGRQGGRGRGQDWQRTSAIEMAVTDKHIRAWSSFLDSEFDYLICFEDDAIFKDNSLSRLTDLLDKLQQEVEITVYVDLAGGLDLGQLHIEKLEFARDDSFVYFKKPVTNTACAYLISRPLATKLYQEILDTPILRYWPVDWLLNKLFMILENKRLKCACWHTYPTIFEHGSTTKYQAW